jgi:hypothetical protein
MRKVILAFLPILLLGTLGSSWDSSGAVPTHALVVSNSTGGSLTMGAVNRATAASSDFELPACSSTVIGQRTWLVTASQLLVSVGVPAGNQIVYAGLSLGAADELDSPNVTAGESVEFLCGSVNTWYVMDSMGAWADGDVPD